MLIAPCGLHTQLYSGKGFPVLRIQPFGVRRLIHIDVPFHAREIDTPLIAGLRERAAGRRLAQDLPRHRNLDRPRVVLIAGTIESAAHIHTHLEAGDVPAVDGRTAIAIRLQQHEIPCGAEGVHLELVVGVRIAVRVDEHFEIVILEDHRIACGEGSPDIRLVELRTDVEEIVIPKHFDGRRETRSRLLRALDVHEQFGR